MSALASGELFAGVGGLGMAVNEVFGADPAWFSEFDAAPSKVLAHHYPDVPNFGDVTKVKWATVPRVNILAGGFPCQDVSLAGRRAGMKDGTRSGLWSEYLKAIDALRPDWVVIENVRGLYSARADSEMEPCTWCLGDGADEYHLRALDAVLADLSAVGFDAEWTGLRAADIGAPHGRFRVFILAWPRERTVAYTHGRVNESRGARADQRGLPGGDGPGARADGDPGRLTLLPTPIVSDGTGGSKNIEASDFAPQMRDIAKLLPTPVAQPSGNTPEEHLRKKPGRGVVTDLAIIAENGLIETGGRLLPTPTASEGEKGGPNQAYGSGGSTLSGTVPHLFPTSRASRGGSATETMYGLGAEREDDERSQGQVVGDITDWGPYESAILRWESVIGRPAPAPVRFDGKGGKSRLNPELTEWMMGWPAGWVTADVNDLTRAEQLKACGNGVVPQQAAAALRILLARPGVPSIERKVAV